MIFHTANDDGAHRRRVLAIRDAVAKPGHIGRIVEAVALAGDAAADR